MGARVLSQGAQGLWRQYLARRRSRRDVPAELSAEDARAGNQCRGSRIENARRLSGAAPDRPVNPTERQTGIRRESMDETEIKSPGGVLRIPPPVLAALLLLGALMLHLAGGPHHHRFVHPHQLLGMLLVAAG